MAERRIFPDNKVGRQRVYTLHDEYVAALINDALSHVERRERQRKIPERREEVCRLP